MNRNTERTIFLFVIAFLIVVLYSQINYNRTLENNSADVAEDLFLAHRRLDSAINKINHHVCQKN